MDGAPHRKMLVSVLAPALLVMLLPGCGQAGGSDADGLARPAPPHSNSEVEIPPIYVDRKIEHLVGGVNELRRGYQQHVALCREAGVPTRPLDPAEQELIGTERWQLWRMPGHAAQRREIWTVATGDIRNGPQCDFRLELSGTHAYYDRERSVFVDLATGEQKTGPVDPEMLKTSAVAGAEDLAKWRGWDGPSESSVLGQECREWRSPRGDIACFWSGGTAWGFSQENTGIFGANTGIAPKSLVLNARPAPGATGDSLTTSRFEIGVTMQPESLLPRPDADRGEKK